MLRERHYFTKRDSTFAIWAALGFLAALFFGGLVLAYLIVIPETVPGLGMLLFKGELGQIVSHRAGVITSWLKEEGDTIHAGEKLAEMVEHDTEKTIAIVAPHTGVIAEITAFNNTAVQKGQTLAIISHEGDPRNDLELTGFVSSLDGKKIKPGMVALIDPTISDVSRHGQMMARVKRVGKLPVTKAAILSILKIPEMSEFIRNQIQAEPFVVVLEPIKDDKTKTGYQWTGPGPDDVLDSGIFARINIVVDRQRLLHMLAPTRFVRRVI